MAKTTPLFAITLCLSALISCHKAGDGAEIPLPTSVTLTTMHHNVPVPEVNVFFKFNSPAFPGYDKPASFFDTVLVSDAHGKVYLHPVTPGNHWAVAFGSSQHSIPLPIYGSMPFQIDTDRHPKADTIIYMFE